jgi:hypothetical protein
MATLSAMTFWRAGFLPVAAKVPPNAGNDGGKMVVWYPPAAAAPPRSGEESIKLPGLTTGDVVNL